MSGRGPILGRPGLALEYLLAALVLASVAAVIKFYAERNFLPQPFIFNTFDTFMDWFNTAYFANQPGAYDVWGAVYPPLSFVFLDVFSITSCYDSPITARNCDWLAITTILLAYVAAGVLAAITFARADRASAWPRSIAFAFGFPMLFCLERGNLILVTLIPFILAYGNLLKSPWTRGLAIALTINFKPYLVLPSLALGMKRKWRALEVAGLLSIGVYLATLIMFGSGDPMQLFANTGRWVDFTSGKFYEQSYFSTSYASLLLVNSSAFPILQFVPSRLVEVVGAAIPVIIGTSQLAVLAGLVAAWFQPRAVPMARVAAMLVGLHLITQSPGGYSLTFLIFLVFMERERRLGSVVALVCSYLLSVTYDWQIATVINGSVVSWLADRIVNASFGLSVGQFVRPALVLVIVWSLSLDTIVQVARAHRVHRPTLGLAAA